MQLGTPLNVLELVTQVSVFLVAQASPPFPHAPQRNPTVLETPRQVVGPLPPQLLGASATAAQ